MSKQRDSTDVRWLSIAGCGSSVLLACRAFSKHFIRPGEVHCPVQVHNIPCQVGNELYCTLSVFLLSIDHHINDSLDNKVMVLCSFTNV